MYFLYLINIQVNTNSEFVEAHLVSSDTANAFCFQGSLQRLISVIVRQTVR